MTRKLQEPTFLILTALLDEPRHGYALLAEIENISDGRVRLRVGTLYAALDRLCLEGLVGVQCEEVVCGRLRRIYGLTQAGADTVAREVVRMTVLAGKARQRLRTAGMVDALTSLAPGTAR